MGILEETEACGVWGQRTNCCMDVFFCRSHVEMSSTIPNVSYIFAFSTILAHSFQFFNALLLLHFPFPPYPFSSKINK